MHNRFPKDLGALLLVFGLFYLIGFFPIWICRLGISILGLLTGRWRTVGWPHLLEGALVGMMIAWAASSSFRHARQERELKQYDYEISGTHLSFKHEPKEPHVSLRGVSDTKLSLEPEKDGYKIVADHQIRDEEIMVRDGEQVLTPRTQGTVAGEGAVGMILVSLGLLSFLSGIARQH